MKNLNYYLEQKYPLVVVQEDDGSYFVKYPDLKGCFSTGDTLEEAFQLSYDAKKAWLETAIDANIDIPTPKNIDDYSGNFKLRMPKSLHKSLADAAKLEGISMNQYCIYILSKELGREHPTKA